MIGSAAGAISELIAHGQTGLMVDRDDPAALADALLGLLNNRTLAREMGRAGRHRAELNFS